MALVKTDSASERFEVPRWICFVTISITVLRMIFSIDKTAKNWKVFSLQSGDIWSHFEGFHLKGAESHFCG
jgi:hypothetical protein